MTDVTEHRLMAALFVGFALNNVYLVYAREGWWRWIAVAFAALWSVLAWRAVRRLTRLT